MIQINQMQADLPIYQKEYPVLYYDNLANVREHTEIVFQQAEQSYHKLPAALLDNIRPDETLYLLRWQKIEKTISLFIKKMNEAQWIKFSMNYYPLKLFITDNNLFLFGAKQLFITSLSSISTKSILLENSKIIDVKLCYTQYNQPGVYVVYFNTKQGYFAKEYSKSYQPTLWTKIKFILKVFSQQKKSQFSYFQTILPNILGIAVIGSQLQIVDLNKMMPTNLKLLFGNFTIKSIRWTLIKQNNSHNEIIKIFILTFSNNILCYNLHISKLQVQNFDKNISIKRIARGTIINWENTIFTKDSFEINSQQSIDHFAVTDKYAVYQENSVGVIPNINLVSFDKSVSISTITRQSSAWRQYYAQPQKTKNFINKFKDQISQPKIITSNDSGIKKLLKIEGSCLDYLNKMRSYNKFEAFIIYKGQICILRTHSIDILHNIPILHFNLQKYTEEHRTKAEALKMGQSVTSSKPLLNEKHQFSSYGKQIILKQYNDIINYVKKSIEFLQCKNREQLYYFGQLPSKSVILVNILRDKFQYFYEIIKYVTGQLKFNERSYKNSQIIRIIQYIYLSFQRYEDQCNVLSSNFLGIFITKNEKELTNNIQLNIVVILKKMFRNILSESFVVDKQVRNNFFVNQYIQFMIELLKEKQSGVVKHLVQQQFKQLITIMFPLQQQQIYDYLMRNISYIRAYFISCHDEESNLPNFCRFMTKMPNYRAIIQELQDIFHLIPNQLDILIKAELQFKKNKVCSTIFFNNSIQAQKIKSADEESSLQQLAHQILTSKIYNKKMIHHQQQQILNQLEEQYIQFENKTYETFSFNNNKLFMLHKQLYEIYKQNKTLSSIVELEENMLRRFVKLFTSQFHKINIVSDDKFQNLQNFLINLLVQIQILFQSYKKYFKNHFFMTKNQDPIYNFNGISVRINQQQGLMSSQFMNQPIQIIGHPLSSILIHFFRRILNSQNLFKLSGKYLLDWQTDQFVNQFLRDIFSANPITYEQMDLIYFCFLKKGQRYMNRFFIRIYKEAPLKILKYLQRLDRKDIIYFMCKELYPDYSPRDRKDLIVNRSSWQMI